MPDPHESPEACEACLRRAWLIGRLADHISNVVDDRPGARVHELLGLSDAELATLMTGPASDEMMAAAREQGPAEVASTMAKRGVWATCEHSGDYPSGLRDLGVARPRALFGLGHRSMLTTLTPKACVAVVGARRSSGYGNRIAKDLARTLAASGVTVVSGMAFGIDAAAHAGALDGGATVAVLGGGCDIPYPASNAALYRRIRRRGIILSELPPGTQARRWTFPARNRTMAAIAGISVVVQAAVRSGSLITASRAREIGRDVGAVPGNVDVPLSAGANSLIADGAALIRGAQDVLDALLGPGVRPASQPLPPLAPEHQASLDAIITGAETADAVAQRAGLDGRAVAIALSRLELLGLITRSAGTYAPTSLALGQDMDIS